MDVIVSSNSRKKAIDQHCKDCLFDSVGGSGTWRQQVDNCTNDKCALYKFRPRSSSTKCPHT